MPLRGENRSYPAYEQLRQIPGGSQAFIHLGVHVGYGVDCIQKTYQRPGREDAVAFAEPRLLRALDHPHIVKILDAQPDGDLEHGITMVMPYYARGSLYDRLVVGESFSTGQVIELVSQIADALDYLHNPHGLLHRDVKPKNLLVADNGALTLCDFGTAASVDDDGHTGPVRATIAYQPPETAGHGWMAPASDVYSLGLVGIEMLDGALLYEGLQAAVVQRRVDSGRRGYTDAALASGARSPHVPGALRALFAQCIRLDPAARPFARELVRALNDLRTVDWSHVEGQGIEGTWIGRWPPRARADRSVDIKVTSRLLKAGRAAGMRRLEASYRRATTGSWRSVGSTLTPVDVAVHDAAAVSTFFRIVSDAIAQRFPACRRTRTTSGGADMSLRRQVGR